MKTVLKLILIYIAFQFLGTWAALPFVMGIQFATTGTLDANLVTQQAIIPGLALTMLFTVWYLWKAGYLTGDSRLYSPLSAGCMGWTVALGAGAIFLLDGLTSALSFLPDWLEGTFDYMQTSWAGILLVALVGPVVEELFFRQSHEGRHLRFVGGEEVLHGLRVPLEENPHAAASPSGSVRHVEALDGRTKPSREDRYEGAAPQILHDLHERHVDGDPHAVEKRLADGENVGRADAPVENHGLGVFPAVEHLRFFAHRSVVDVTRVGAQVFGRKGHPESLHVLGTRDGKINVSPAAHVDEPREGGFARERRDFAEPLLHVRLLQAPEDFDRHLGVKFLEAVEKPRQTPGGEARGRGEADLPFQGLAVVRNLRDERVVGAKDRFHALQCVRAFLREFERPRVVPHERDAQGLLKSRDRARNVRRVHVHRGRGRRERARAREGDKVAPGGEVVEFGHENILCGRE